MQYDLGLPQFGHRSGRDAQQALALAIIAPEKKLFIDDGENTDQLPLPFNHWDEHWLDFFGGVFGRPPRILSDTQEE